MKTDEDIPRGSWAEGREAEHAAWRPPDVREVENLFWINVWPAPWDGAPRPWPALQGKRQGCSSR
jgi:hypothetical protein